ARGDRGGDRRQVEVESRRVEQHAHGGRALRHDQRLVEEPGRGKEDDHVARSGQRGQADGEGGERAIGQKNVLRVERAPVPLLQRGGDDLPRARLVVLVGEPVLVLWDEPSLERRDDGGEGRLVRIAEDEVAGCLVVRVAPRISGVPQEGEEGFVGRLDGGV